jgi:RNA polymerase sigma-70 factor (ECF subfamily)
MNRALPEESPLPGEAAGAGGGLPHAEALRCLFREHNHALHSFLLMKLSGNEQEAQEVAQEAYARLLQLHEPGAVSLMRAYLFKTAANIAVDRARQRIARARLDQAIFLEEPVDAVSPDRRVLAAEELAIVERALNELPPKCRRAFILHRFEEWSAEQIAAELGIRTRMVRRYVSRAAIYCKLRLEGLSPAQARDEVMP